MRGKGKREGEGAGGGGKIVVKKSEHIEMI